MGQKSNVIRAAEGMVVMRASEVLKCAHAFMYGSLMLGELLHADGDGLQIDDVWDAYEVDFDTASAAMQQMFYAAHEALGDSTSASLLDEVGLVADARTFADEALVDLMVSKREVARTAFFGLAVLLDVMDETAGWFAKDKPRRKAAKRAAQQIGCELDFLGSALKEARTLTPVILMRLSDATEFAHAA